MNMPGSAQRQPALRLVPATLGMAEPARVAAPRAVLKTLALASATGPLAWAAWRADPLDWTADYRSAPASCAKWRSATDPVFT